MIEVLRANLAGLFIDLSFIAISALVLFHYRSKAAFALLANFSIILAIQLLAMNSKYWPVFFIDFHLYLAIFGLLFFVLVHIKAKGYMLLKFCIALEISLHLLVVIAAQLFVNLKISKGVFAVIYDSYPTARIMLASFQIVGVINVDRINRRGRRYFVNSRASAVDFVNRYFLRNTRISRVKGL